MGVEWSLKFRPKSLLENCISRTQALVKEWVVWTSRVGKGYIWCFITLTGNIVFHFEQDT